MNIKFLTLILVLFLQPIYSSIAQAYQVQTSQKTTQINGVNYFEHTVEKGNTLYNISQTYGVSKEDILQANPTLNTENIQLGEHLLIPISPNKHQTTTYHITKKGETLYSIARDYNSSVAEIKQLNRMSDNVLSEGQYIKVPQKSNNNTTIQQKPTKKKPYHIIRPKESLYAISKQWGVSVQKIMAENHLKTHHIKAFDTLWIPLEQGNTNALSLDSSPFITHQVQASETLYSIARHYAVSIKEIKKYNHLINNDIKNGQSLKIPRRLNNKSYIEHIVKKRKERLSDIAKLYIVPLKKLKALNPHIGRKASRGETVLIPLPYIESEWKIKTSDNTNDIITDEDIEPIEDNDNTVIEESVAIGNCTPMTYQERSYKVTLLLPLELEQLNTQNINDTSALLQQKEDISFKFLEFYEGAIIAAQQLSAQGLDFKLEVIDIPKNTQNIASLLETSDIQNSDLIISLLYTNSFTQAAQFANKYHIPLVNTVSKRRKILYQNPYVYKVQSNQKGVYKKAVDFIKAQHANDNIIIVRHNAYELNKEYNTLLQQLKNGLSAKIEIPNSIILHKANIFEQAYTDNLSSTSEETDVYNAARIWQIFKTHNPSFDIHRIKANSEKSTSFSNRIHTVVYDAEHGLDQLLKVINPFANNMIIGLSNKEVFAIELFTKLNYINKHLNMQVIGLPHWDSFKNLDIAHIQALDLHVVTSTFINYNNPEVKSFIQKFRQNFNTEPLPNHHAFLGYDISLYFMTALKYFGANFDQCLPALKVPLLERDLEFKTTTLGGKENQHWKVLKQENYIYKPIY